MAVCPVYQASFRESDAPRGRLALLETLRRSAHGTRRLKEILSRCLLCGACAQVCANRVDTVSILQAGRSRLFPDHGGGTGDLFAQGDWERILSKRLVSKGGTLLQALVCRHIPQSSGLHIRFPLRFFTQRKTIPALAEESFIEAFGKNKPDKPTQIRVGLFVGCGANYLFTESAWALVAILRRLDVTVIVPSAQGCCGLPAFVSGNDSRAATLARKNIEVFEQAGVDAVLTVCASCGSHLQGLAQVFKESPSWRRRAQALADKHKDAMRFLVEDTRVASLFKPSPVGTGQPSLPMNRVAYHDPCHLRIGQGVVDAPREFLTMVPGVELVEASHPGRCCGHGGGFNLSHFPVSMEILEKRMTDFKSLAPDTIATGCTGCLLQFMEGMGRMTREHRIRVCHPLVLAQQALSKNRL